MRIVRIHIENFRCLQQLTLRPNPGVTVLVGRNNSGKSAVLAALDRALGRGAQHFDLDDFFLAGPNVDVGALPRIRIEIEIRPTPLAEFSEAFTATFVDDIDIDQGGNQFIALRTDAVFDAVEGRARIEHFAVKANGDAQALPARRRFALRSYIPFYLADAFRDVVRELRDRRGFWGRLVGSVVMDTATITTVQANIQTINAAILANTPRLNELRERLREMGRVIATAAPPDDLVLSPVSIDAPDILRNLDVLLRTIEAPRGFSLERHGEGTRSVRSLKSIFTCTRAGRLPTF